MNKQLGRPIIYRSIKDIGNEYKLHRSNEYYLENKEYYEINVKIYHNIMHCLSFITPRDLINMFPISKIYNGKKYGMRDYFSTMEELNNHGLDNPIGNKVLELLMEYENKDIFYFIMFGIKAGDYERYLDGKQSMIFEVFPDLQCYTKDEITGELNPITKSNNIKTYSLEEIMEDINNKI